MIVTENESKFLMHSARKIQDILKITKAFIGIRSSTNIVQVASCLYHWSASKNGISLSQAVQFP